MAKKILYVLVRGWVSQGDWIPRLRGDAHGEFSSDFQALFASIPNAEIIVPELDMGFFSCADPEELAEVLLSAVDDAFEPDTHQQIVFVAYSSGAPVARYALSNAYGIDERGNLNQNQQREWCGRVARIVYLSGILRGWHISTALPASVRFFSPITFFVSTAATLLFKKGTAFIYKIRRGDPFIVTGRLRQVALRDQVACGRIEPAGLGGISRRKNGTPCLPFEQISLLGTQDEFVAPVDCIERGYSQSTIYSEVPNTNHMQMLDVGGEANGSGKIIRKEHLLRALSENFVQLADDKEFTIDPDDLNDHFDELDRPQPEQSSKAPQVKHVVIVLHGIRDHGFWTKRIARIVKDGDIRPLIRAPSPSYGFFSLIDFVLPWIRTRQAKWFMDFYADVRELFPQSRDDVESGISNVSFVGHSNGTFLAAKSMKLCELIHFRRMIFAGSVVRRDFDWESVREQLQDRVLNVVGANDAVVGLLPGAFERLGLRFLDVGGAGFHGFSQEKHETIVRNVIVDGGHGAVIGESNWSKFRDFILDGTVPNEAVVKSSPLRNILLAAAPLILVVALCVLGVLVVSLFLRIPSDWGEVRVLFLGLLAYMISKFLRFF